MAVAKAEIAMVKLVAPNMVCDIIDMPTSKPRRVRQKSIKKEAAFKTPV
jgi:hypothetical protein